MCARCSIITWWGKLIIIRVFENYNHDLKCNLIIFFLNDIIYNNNIVITYQAAIKNPQNHVASTRMQPMTNRRNPISTQIVIFPPDSYQISLWSTKQVRLSGVPRSTTRWPQPGSNSQHLYCDMVYNECALNWWVMNWLPSFFARRGLSPLTQESPVVFFPTT